MAALRLILIVPDDQNTFQRPILLENDCPNLDARGFTADLLAIAVEHFRIFKRQNR
jgi:hypothetical protein